MNIVLFSKDEINKPLLLTDSRAKHILNILHKKEDDCFEAGILNEYAGIATIKKITDKELFFDFQQTWDGGKLHPLIMIIGFPRPIQLKRLLRDIASLGVQEVHLVGTELGEKSYLKSNLAEHDVAYEMLKDGSIQAKSCHVPDLFIHQTLNDGLIFLKEKNNAIKIGLDNIKAEGSILYHPNFSESSNSIYEKNVIAAIGSERGWTDKERELLIKNGFSLRSMGNRVLRTETAATTAVALILSKMGVI